MRVKYLISVLQSHSSPASYRKTKNVLSISIKKVIERNNCAAKGKQNDWTNVAYLFGLKNN